MRYKNADDSNEIKWIKDLTDYSVTVYIKQSVNNLMCHNLLSNLPPISGRL